MSGINITNFVLEQRRKLFAAVQAAGINTNDVVEKVDRRFPFGNWKHPVEVWKKPILSNGKGVHLANYWLSYPRKGSDTKTVKFNLQTFDSISSWLNQSPPPPPSATKSLSTADATSQF